MAESQSAAFKHCSQYHIIYRNNLLSFVKHIKVKESPSKMLKISTVYSSVYVLPQSDHFAYNTNSETYQD